MIKVLVIDDDDLVRGMISNTLRKASFDVYEADNGNDGLTQASHIKPGIIITDILMPDKEGIETIVELKQRDNNYKIIAMSGGGTSKNMAFLEIAKKAGADKALTKPFKSSELLQTIQDLLTT